MDPEEPSDPPPSPCPLSNATPDSTEQGPEEGCSSHTDTQPPPPGSPRQNTASPGRHTESPQEHSSNTQQHTLGEHTRALSPHQRKESPHGRKESPHQRKESPHGRKESPHQRKESPHGRKESPHECKAESRSSELVPAGVSSGGMPSSPGKHDKSSDRAAANARLSHGSRERHGHHPPQNRASNQSGGGGGGACVNANHGSRSQPSRNLHRDGHHHHRERQRHSSTSRDRQEPSNAALADRDDEVDDDDRALDGAVADLRLDGDELVRVSSASNVNGLVAGTGVQANSGPSHNAPTNPLNHNQVHYNWQAGKTTLKERLAFMFNNEIMADVHFIVGKGGSTQRIPAHKFVLAIGSAVFDAMFNGGMATTSSDVELPDVEPAAFLALLKFLYSDEVHIGPETVMTTLYTAKKYAVPSLERSCVEFLKRNLSSDNAFMLLTQARLFDEPQLAALCLESIDKKTSEALAAEGFTDIDLDTLCVVLERDTLGIRECKLFNAVCRWSEAECVRENLPVGGANQRLVLSRALQLIRFPLMTVEEFAMGAAQSGILSDREVVELFLYYTVNPKPSVNFQDTPRCCLTGKEQVVSRFCQIESRWGYSGTSDRIRFMVNRRIFVVGFGLYGSIHGPAEYTVSVQIIHTDSGKVCGVNDTTFQCDGTNSTFRVMFKEPVEIQPNTSFTACSTLKGPDSYYGTKGLRKVTHESVTSGKVTFQFTYAAGNNNGTSVEDGQLPEIIFYT